MYLTSCVSLIFVSSDHTIRKMCDRLVKVNSFGLAALKKSYEVVGLKTYVTYATIKGYMNWLEKDPNIKNLTFYCLNGDVSDGTFAVIDRYVAYADTLCEGYDQDRLFRLLKLLDLSLGFTFFCVRSEVQATIVKAIESAGVDLICNDINLLYHCPRQRALKFDVKIPNTVQLRPLNIETDVQKINAVWPHRTVNTFKYFQRLVKYNSSVGAYQNDGTLVSWTIRDPTGMIGALQTDGNYFGRGYGKLVVKSLAKSIAQDGDDIFASIYENNAVSRRIFSGLGFDLVGEVNWIVTKCNWHSDNSNE